MIYTSFLFCVRIAFHFDFLSEEENTCQVERLKLLKQFSEMLTKV